ncbi:FKBP-type peptidyl-prolyl cis-trans isomerase [Enemella sp. A6]|uniref:FKBP-type peptidyl-prolyl cis-trans isomerase n=1 Tax=Enemella sp. A6 TaxID=3440152 RepID=UPI003EBA1EF5
MQYISRRVGAALVALTLTATLAACSGDDPETSETTEPSVAGPTDGTPAPTEQPTPTPTPEPTPQPEPTTLQNLDAIKVSGELNQKVQVTVPAPMKVDQTQAKVLVQGKGSKVPEGGQVLVHYTGVNGRSGEEFDSSWSRGEEPTPFPLDQVVPGFAKGLAGKQVGSRVLIAMTGKDGYDSMGGNPPTIQVGDTLVFVVDIVGTQLAGPEGDQVQPKAGLPTVSGELNAPKVTIPKSEPPTDLVVQPLIKGKGAEVAPTDTIVADYQMVSWKTGEVIDQSYGRKPASGEVSRLIKGWVEGLPGQTVGSRVLLVVPPNLAYGDSGYDDPKVEGGDTLVFVVDILMSTPAE